MLDRPLATLFLIIVSLAPRVPAWASCRSVAAAPSLPKKVLLHVLPARAFQGPNDPLKVVTVLLKEYLAHAKPPRKETTVSVDVTSAGKGQFRAIAVLGEKRFDAPFAFPNTLNDALTGLVETLTRELNVPMEAKKLLPFLNETDSATAYLRYADGALSLEEKDVLNQADTEQATAAFEEAVRADYNYVQAYAGLAEALAARAVLEDAPPLRTRAGTEMQKAKLLNPYRAKMREDRVNWYLKDAHCAEAKEAR